MSEYDGSKPLKNEKHEKFCHCYINHYNAARAVREAGYSEKGARQKGSELLTIVDVQARKNYLDRMAVEALGVTKERIQKELTAIAFANPDDVMEWGDTVMIEVEVDGNTERVPYHGIKIKNSEDLPQEIRAAIKKVKQGKDGLEIELHDKHAALKTLAAQAGMVTDNTKTATEVSVKQAPTVNVVIEKA